MKKSTAIRGSLSMIVVLVAIAAIRKPDLVMRVADLGGKVLTPNSTVEGRLAEFGNDVEERVRPSCEGAGLTYPPNEIAIVAFKDSRHLEVYGRARATDTWRRFRTYPVLAASGRLGPKLKEGDQQVPEGIYHAESLNPNSQFHVSIRVSYPNEFDRRMARADKRANLGDDIMIHGNAVSIGCIAVGDPASEDLFVLAAKAMAVRIVISPTDFRIGTPESLPTTPPWIKDLYGRLVDELSHYPSSKP